MILPFTGSCACEAVKYSCSEAPVRMLNCHCRDCQKAGGSGYSPTLIVRASELRVTGATKEFGKLAASGNIAVRNFCENCGSPLFASSSGRSEFIAIRAATLDDPSWFTPEADVWVASAQRWNCMNPDIPKFEKNRTTRSEIG
jgi:hypothetical protein